MRAALRAALRALPALLAALSAAVSALSDAELRSVAERLYAADRNRAAPAELRVNLQHRIDAASGAGNDYAPLPLFEHVDEALLRRSPFAELLALLDNYEAQCGVEEEPTAEEQREEQRFLDAVLNTDVMEELLQSGLWGSRSALRAALQQLWFGRYSRSGGAALDSSGFEHVFVGEIKNSRVSGCHSWVQLQQLERSGRLNYLSYSYDGPVSVRRGLRGGVTAVCGCVVVWLCHCVTVVWLCHCVTAVCGCVVVWLRRCVTVVWLCHCVTAVCGCVVVSLRCVVVSLCGC
uniref:Uridylate-specific endoribonuclease n=1 Tax=Phasianus colchicus TaxID=9054 RepID=A0A669QBK7_PHACC